MGQPLAFVKLSPTKLRQLLTNILLISTGKLGINNRVLGEIELFGHPLEVKIRVQILSSGQ